MPNRKLIMTLAKTIIAAAWADGQVSVEEINNLKWFLLQLRKTGQRQGVELTGLEWARLQMYMDTPVTPAERERLVVELQNNLRSNKDRQLAIQALREVMAVDGEMTEQERQVLEEMEAALNEVSVGVVGLMERLVGNRVHQRRAEVGEAPNREMYFDDFLSNKVYYALARHLRDKEIELDLTEDEQRKLGLAGGLMAKVAHLDGTLSDRELAAMIQTIQRYWKLGDMAATFVAEVAVAAVNETYDTTRIMHRLAKVASKDERRQIVTALFAVAAADGDISTDEHEEIRIMARGMKLTHQDFINAKLQVLGNDSVANNHLTMK